MAYKVFDGLSGNGDVGTIQHEPVVLQAEGLRVDLPDSAYVRDADISRDGMDLVLQGPDGTIVIEGYFAAEPVPNLVAPDGAALTPGLVQSFIQSPAQYADAGSANDASPVGAVQEVSGKATVTRTDGTVDTITIGTPIYQGDVIDTEANGAVNIVFIDETSFAVSEDARLAIDEYVFDPATQSGSSNFSVLKGVFVFTSGLIGRDDPDDVEIDTPVGSIGIRGTIIAGDVDSGEITVVEGAIVLRDFQGNEMTLATQFETAKFMPNSGGISHMGQLAANDVSGKFSSVSGVSPNLFSSINDAAGEQGGSSHAPAGSNASGNDAAGEQQNQTNTQGAAEAIDEAPAQNTQGDTTGMHDGSTGFDDTLTEPALTTAPPPPLHYSTTQTNTGSILPPPPPPPSGSTEETTTAEPLPPPPFTVFVEKAIVSENADGAKVVRLIGKNTTFMKLELMGSFKDDVDLIRIDDLTFEIRLKSSVSIDYDDFLANPGDYELGFRALSANGVEYRDYLRPDVHDSNNAPYYLNKPTPAEFFTAADGVHWQYHFDKEFGDGNTGDMLTYSLSAATVTALNAYAGPQGSNWTFNATDGLLNINFGAGAASTQNFNIEVTATDQAGLSVNHSFGFTAYQTTHTFPSVNMSSITGGIIAKNSVTMGFDINTSNNKIFFGDGADTDITIMTSMTGNLVNLGNGNDILEIQSGASNNVIIGGYGHDTMKINALQQNKFYGGDGADDFIILDTVWGDMTATSGLLIDGGHDDFSFGGTDRGDSLIMNQAGSIDFTAINDNFIRNIERLDTDQANYGFAPGANAVTISYSDVIAMTSVKNRLIFDMDAGDTLSFDNEGKSFTFTGTVTRDDSNANAPSNTETYDVYTDGTVTLLVSQDLGTLTGLPA